MMVRARPPQRLQRVCLRSEGTGRRGPPRTLDATTLPVRPCFAQAMERAEQQLALDLRLGLHERKPNPARSASGPAQLGNNGLVSLDGRIIRMSPRVRLEFLSLTLELVR